MGKNICKYNTPDKTNNERISIMQFFQEQKNNDEKISFNVHFYRLHLITQGTATFKILGKNFQLKKGDLFLTFPFVDFSFSNTSSLTYLCISYLDFSKNKLENHAKIDHENFYFENLEKLIPQWETFFKNATPNNIDLIAESLLLYTFGYISTENKEDKKISTEKFILELKQEAELHFHEPNFSLKKICIEKNYNINYVSSAFKRIVGSTFWAYVNILRINHAFSLFENGFTSIKQVAYMCGFRDPNYFSTVFKKMAGVSPKEFIANLKK